VGKRGHNVRKVVDFAAGNEDMRGEFETVVQALGPLANEGSGVVVSLLAGQSRPYLWIGEDVTTTEPALVWEGDEFAAGLEHVLQNAQAGSYYQLCVTPPEG